MANRSISIFAYAQNIFAFALATRFDALLQMSFAPDVAKSSAGWLESTFSLISHVMVAFHISTYSSAEIPVPRIGSGSTSLGS